MGGNSYAPIDRGRRGRRQRLPRLRPSTLTVLCACAAAAAGATLFLGTRALGWVDGPPGQGHGRTWGMDAVLGPATVTAGGGSMPPALAAWAQFPNGRQKEEKERSGCSFDAT